MTTTETRPSLENDARLLAISLERHQVAILLLLTFVYAIGAVSNAHSKPLWYDEIITTFSSSAKSPGMTWFLAQQTDLNPPLPHLLVHFATRLVPNLEIGTRIPAIVGFWIFCLCLYHFTRRRVGICFGLSAMLIPVVTSAYGYALEARAYGLVLGFCGIALVGWQTAAEGEKRFWGLVTMLAGLSGALLSHYYAVLIYLPLAGAEAFRLLRRRRPDWPMWAALAAAMVPMLWRAASIKGTGRWTTHTWSPPSVMQIPEFWETGLQQMATTLVLALVVVALAIIARRGSDDPTPDGRVALKEHELVAGVLFLAVPVAAVAGALFVTHLFTPRYALFALAGFAFLAPMVTAYISRGNALVGFLMVLALIPGFGSRALASPFLQNPLSQEPILTKALQSGPVVIADGLLFLPSWHYAPEDLKSRVQFVADSEAAVKYMGFDSIDEGMILVRPWVTLPIIDYRGFYARGKEFLLYQNTLRPGWLLPRIVEEGGSAEVLASSGFRQLIRVRFKGE